MGPRKVRGVTARSVAGEQVDTAASGRTMVLSAKRRFVALMPLCAPPLPMATMTPFSPSRPAARDRDPPSSFSPSNSAANSAAASAPATPTAPYPTGSAIAAIPPRAGACAASARLSNPPCFASRKPGPSSISGPSTKNTPKPLPPRSAPTLRLRRSKCCAPPPLPAPPASTRPPPKASATSRAWPSSCNASKPPTRLSPPAAARRPPAPPRNPCPTGNPPHRCETVRNCAG